ncbi:polycystic kidney disease 2-like 2 protein [Drosophila innubila]|uniref:polycystic kidney disease 2-like 2 protein n=1 Tax=Drosophila innubila TaxID=198719 RepID=UPI00148D6377|nr:polycystic kidney disease 2-like 2 protein [Drosophila innubila]
MRILMCDFDYISMHEVQPILAPIYFIAAIVTIYGILINLFVAIFLSTYSEVKSSIYVRDTEVFEMLMKGFRNYFCFGRNESELEDKMYIDKLITKDERPEPNQTYETQPNVEPMRDLREELAQLTERIFQIEHVLERFVGTIELISKLQEKKPKRRQQKQQQQKGSPAST